MKATIISLAGDGIGPEITAQAERVLTAVAGHFGHQFDIERALIGGCAIDATGEPLPKETLDACDRADAILLGAIGGPKWDDPNAKIRPEQGLLGLRKHLGLYANIRPVTIFPELRHASPLKDDRLDGVDFIVVRELTGGIYFGEKTRSADAASDLCTYTVTEIERIVRVAAQMAMARGRKLHSIDKANVLETSRLWRTTTERVIAEEFPEIQLEHMLVDAAAMHLLRRPADFDVVVTENMFGDIITDEAGMVAGSLGLLPSASLGASQAGLYEPIHGSAPDIAGLGIANPYGTILSAAMLLRHSLKLEREARLVEEAVSRAVRERVFTPDLQANSETKTVDVGDAVIAAMAKLTQEIAANDAAYA